MTNFEGPGSAALRRGRVSIPQQVYLITTVCLDRRPVFRNPAAAMAAANVLHSAECWPKAEVYAWVLMPDHWHGLVRLDDTEMLSRVVQRFKGLVSIKLRRSGLWTEVVWQKGFHDHALRREESVLASAEYVLNNPVRVGLAERWHQWPYVGGSWVQKMLAGTTSGA